MSRAVLLAALVALALPSAAHAEAEAAPAKVKQENAKRTKIRRLLALTGSAELGMQVMEQMFRSFQRSMPNVPESFWTELRKEVHPDDLVELIVPIYERNLSEADIDALVTFYESQAGKRFTAALPKITAESQSAGEQWGRQLAERVLTRLKQEGYR